MNRFVTTFVIFASAAVAACASGSPNLTQLGADALMDRAASYLAERKWSDAVAAFEQFTIRFPNHARVQEARFRLGEAYFGKKEYITAGEEFNRLASDYPAGPWGDDSRFKVCESYYRLSPKTQLDQQYTRAAIDHCQSLVAYYPNSEFVQRAQQLADELRNKLADKEYQAGEFYFKRGAYDSAIIYYEVTLRDFADTSYGPRALLRLYQTYQNIGYKEEAETARARLLKDFPNSPEARGLQPAPAATTTTSQ
ncbi:MAG TPA: outer membrane protein assembly factor BamD [Longimicrobiales bacterium]